MDELASPARPRANRSLGRGALFALRCADLFTRQSVVNKTTLIDLPGGQGLRHAAKWLVKRFPSRALRLPADIEAHIDAFYGASNARLAAMRGLPLAALGYPLAPLGYSLADVQEADRGEGLAKDAA